MRKNDAICCTYSGGDKGSTEDHVPSLSYILTDTESSFTITPYTHGVMSVFVD